MALAALVYLATLQFSFSPGLMMAAPSLAIQRPEVRKELKPTKDQNRQLDEVAKSVTKAMQGAGKSMDISAMGTAMREGDAKVWEILDDTQDARLRGLILQIKGPAALTEEDFIKEYSLTSEQVAKLEELKTKCREDYLAAAQKNQKKIKGLLEQYEKDAFAVLTTEQKAVYDKAIGAKVKNLNMGMPP